MGNLEKVQIKIGGSALTFAELSSGEQRALKEMGVAETVQANEKVGIIARPKKTKATSSPLQSGK